VEYKKDVHKLVSRVSIFLLFDKGPSKKLSLWTHQFPVAFDLFDLALAIETSTQFISQPTWQQLVPLWF